ncbi:hypothetical protein ACLOJK_005419 [Asimina triloba]
MSPPPIYRGGAAEFSVGIYVGGSNRLWVVGSRGGVAPSRCLRSATVAPPAAVPTVGHYSLPHHFLHQFGVKISKLLTISSPCRRSPLPVSSLPTQPPCRQNQQLWTLWYNLQSL